MITKNFDTGKSFEILGNHDVVRGSGYQKMTSYMNFDTKNEVIQPSPPTNFGTLEGEWPVPEMDPKVCQTPKSILLNSN